LKVASTTVAKAAIRAECIRVDLVEAKVMMDVEPRERVMTEKSMALPSLAPSTVEAKEARRALPCRGHAIVDESETTASTVHPRPRS
jgi:hypothetical protein